MHTLGSVDSLKAETEPRRNRWAAPPGAGRLLLAGGVGVGAGGGFGASGSFRTLPPAGSPPGPEATAARPERSRGGATLGTGWEPRPLRIPHSRSRRL